MGIGLPPNSPEEPRTSRATQNPPYFGSFPPSGSLRENFGESMGNCRDPWGAVGGARGRHLDSKKAQIHLGGETLSGRVPGDAPRPGGTAGGALQTRRMTDEHAPLNDLGEIRHDLFPEKLDALQAFFRVHPQEINPKKHVFGAELVPAAGVASDYPIFSSCHRVDWGQI